MRGIVCRRKRESSSFIFSSINYDYNVWIYILGIVLFLSGVLVMYHCLLKKYITALKEDNGIRVVFGILAFLLSAGMVAVLAFSLFAMVGMSGNLKPDWMMLFTVIGWPILTFLFLIVMMIREIRK